MPHMVVVCNIFEESGVIFTNTFIIWLFLFYAYLFIVGNIVIRLYLLKFVNNLNIEF